MEHQPPQVPAERLRARVIAFFDGQNLYHLAKEAWGSDPKDKNAGVYLWPSYDVVKMANFLVARKPDRTLHQARFYTGVPHPSASNMTKFWHGFWTNKIRALLSQKVYVYKGRVNPGGQEKGVDVSIAIDLIKLTYEKAFDVAIIVSQDHDFGPAVQMAKEVAKSQGRMLGFESAFPRKDAEQRGVPGTEWYPIRKSEYDTCLDSREYRSKPIL